MSAQPEALRIANALNREWHDDALNYDTALDAAAELRRLHAEIEAERQSRQAAQIENEALKARIARADVELQRAVIAEREACAAICDRFQRRDVGMQPAECAGAIRARGAA